jgi:hypothetical protein
MMCSKCHNDGVKNEIFGQTFYYCRTCKEEIQLEVVESVASETKLLELPSSHLLKFTDKTGLKWSELSLTNMTYSGAFQYAKRMGYRLPTVKECDKISGSNDPQIFQYLMGHDFWVDDGARETAISFGPRNFAFYPSLMEKFRVVLVK